MSLQLIKILVINGKWQVKVQSSVTNQQLSDHCHLASRSFESNAVNFFELNTYPQIACTDSSFLTTVTTKWLTINKQLETSQ